MLPHKEITDLCELDGFDAGIVYELLLNIYVNYSLYKYAYHFKVSVVCTSYTLKF